MSDINADRADWERFKDQIGLTGDAEAAAPNHVEVKSDGAGVNFEILPSQIAGFGTCAKRYFAAGDPVGEAWIGGKRTELGCFGNHSMAPNAAMEPTGAGPDVLLRAISDIAPGDEVTTNYRETIIAMLGARHYE